MGVTAAAAAVYDADVRDHGLATLPLEQSPWLPLYDAAGDMLTRAGYGPIVDLGCGTGRFARWLCDHDCSDYLGVDFAAEAISEAARYVSDGVELGRCRFDVCDLRDWQPGMVHGSTVFVCLEVLEHLDDDRELIGRIPPGHRVVFSVPNYPSSTHVRCFPHLREVFVRYDRMLDITAWQALDMGHPARRIHLVDSRRRGDSWS